METPPDTISSLLPTPRQLTRPHKDVCVATRGAGPGAQPEEISVPCGPPQIGAQLRGEQAGRMYDYKEGETNLRSEVELEDNWKYTESKTFQRADLEATRRYEFVNGQYVAETQNADSEVMLRWPEPTDNRSSVYGSMNFQSPAAVLSQGYRPGVDMSAPVSMICNVKL